MNIRKIKTTAVMTLTVCTLLNSFPTSAQDTPKKASVLDDLEAGEITFGKAAKPPVPNLSAALDPFALARSLGSHLESICVEIYEKSAVTKILEKKLEVNGYEITCPISIRATEAFTPRSWMGNRQIPIYSLMVATEPLPSDVITQMRNNQRATFQEACHLITYAQITGDNRLAIGGRGVRYKFFSRLSERSEIDIECIRH